MGEVPRVKPYSSELNPTSPIHKTANKNTKRAYKKGRKRQIKNLNMTGLGVGEVPRANPYSS